MHTNRWWVTISYKTNIFKRTLAHRCSYRRKVSVGLLINVNTGSDNFRNEISILEIGFWRRVLYEPLLKQTGKNYFTIAQHTCHLAVLLSYNFFFHENNSKFSWGRVAVMFFVLFFQIMEKEHTHSEFYYNIVIGRLFNSIWQGFWHYIFVFLLFFCKNFLFGTLNWHCHATKADLRLFFPFFPFCDTLLLNLSAALETMKHVQFACTILDLNYHVSTVIQRNICLQ